MIELFLCLICRCCECGASLSHWYYEKDGRLFCKKDYWAKFGELCHGCSEPISTGLIMVSPNGQKPNLCVSPHPQSCCPSVCPTAAPVTRLCTDSPFTHEQINSTPVCAREELLSIIQTQSSWMHSLLAVLAFLQERELFMWQESCESFMSEFLHCVWFFTC